MNENDAIRETRKNKFLQKLREKEKTNAFYQQRSPYHPQTTPAPFPSQATNQHSFAQNEFNNKTLINKLEEINSLKARNNSLYYIKKFAIIMITCLHCYEATIISEIKPFLVTVFLTEATFVYLSYLNTSKIRSLSEGYGKLDDKLFGDPEEKDESFFMKILTKVLSNFGFVDYFFEAYNLIWDIINDYYIILIINITYLIGNTYDE